MRHLWRVRIGIDLGGTKIEGIALADDGREIARRLVATPRGDYDATLRAVAELVAKLERGAERPTVGIGTPGAPSRDDELDEEPQLNVAERPGATRRSRSSARARSANR